MFVLASWQKMPLLREDNLMPFIDKELQKLSQDIINRAIQGQTPTGASIGVPMIEKLRQSILKRQQVKLPRV